MFLRFLLLAAILLESLAVLNAEDSGIAWLLQWNGQSFPTAPWAVIGHPDAKISNGALQLSDASKHDLGAYEAEWTGELDGQEIIVEARVKLVRRVGRWRSRR